MIEAPLTSPLADQPAMRPILVILHQATSSPGRVGIMLRQMGFPLDIRRPALGDNLPGSLDDHAGVVVFGGPMSANDDEAFIHRETDWLTVPLSENRPLLGLCLGAQMMVNHLGGKVQKPADGRAEYGWYDLEPTEAGRDLFDQWPAKVLQFHKEGVTLPSEAALLARGEENFPNQAFAIGSNAIGVQFHPELTALMLHRWVVKAHERFSLPGAQNAKACLEGRLIFDEPLRRWAVNLLEHLFNGKPGGPERRTPLESAR
ncbi:glutamine amidotransferase [Notoacmeibacter ruber]|uniref:Glutamine amidotransferase n=1 Tax=Notoacmeibacter ruber TaxID=2670375 RepID=A0A3L7JFB1_9HYPH|nr:glutamine amidotransferase [Notoacmeibacter ruber]RLQ89015.1 glutamine amidotransferase [Notoacmeibacter ruber]